jgi:O-antigen/teichoic acid export membrane protein
MVYYQLVENFIGQDFHDSRGLVIVPVLLLANLFLGIYYNLSIWYKLTEKTRFGAFLSVFGAFITISANFLLIPYFGFVGSAWATLLCYFAMAVASYFLGQKHYPIPYPIARISIYLVLMLGLYGCSLYLDFGMLYNSIYIILFLVSVFLLEKPKKA